MILSYCSFNTEHVDWKKKKKKTAFLLASDIFKTEDVSCIIQKTSKTALLITTLLDFWRVW